MIDSKIEPGAQHRNYRAAHTAHCQRPSAWKKSFFGSLALFNRKMQRISGENFFLFVFINIWQKNAAIIPKPPRARAMSIRSNRSQLNNDDIFVSVKHLF